eukprot:TRINITY_DN32411_c0_g1_i1.p1 TRINITY_DN32411_c0_g1~~TRINITY_DN32411_c0_g1_i1.p1  ORF type:complete len:189 (-),score=18.56 TRINITY_DN32411_c0_g1_i1:550-1116(-)
MRWLKNPFSKAGMEESTKTEEAAFAAGCFWGVQQAFAVMPGVIKTKAGYTQGTTEDPTYEDVCAGSTGHAEAVWVEYDPKLVSYEKLLTKFWGIHSPTRGARKSQYRSGIYFYTPEQEKTARESFATLQRKLTSEFDPTNALEGDTAPILATEIAAAKTFYAAEDYHQNYFDIRAARLANRARLHNAQ